MHLPFKAPKTGSSQGNPSNVFLNVGSKGSQKPDFGLPYRKNATKESSGFSIFHDANLPPDRLKITAWDKAKLGTSVVRGFLQGAIPSMIIWAVCNGTSTCLNAIKQGSMDAISKTSIKEGIVSLGVFVSFSLARTINRIIKRGDESIHLQGISSLSQLWEIPAPQRILYTLMNLFSGISSAGFIAGIPCLLIGALFSPTAAWIAFGASIAYGVYSDFRDPDGHNSPG